MNYWDYIRVEDLLSLQHGIDTPENPPSKDEVLFITVHQIYELWFKLVLNELRSVRDLLRQNPVPDQQLSEAVRALRRCITIFELAQEHWKVVETLTTRDYLEFRDRLVGASGFQSPQMRQMEVLLGLNQNDRIPVGGLKDYREHLRSDSGEKTWAYDQVTAEIEDGPTFRAALHGWLARTPIDGSIEPDAVEAYLQRFLAARSAHNETLMDQSVTGKSPEVTASVRQRYQHDIDHAREFLMAEDIPSDGSPGQTRARNDRRHVRAALLFIESHRELPRLAWPRELVDSVLILEQSMVIWRQRHARMVERTIGRRTGTGGSGGVAYLDATATKYRIFNDVWAVRSLLLRRDLVPELQNEDDYRFRVEDAP